MDKSEFKKIFRRVMKEHGFTVKGNYSYKMVDEDYLVFVRLDSHSYTDAYYVEYGATYEPIEIHKKNSGYCDWDMRFLFTVNPSDNLSNYPIDNLNWHYNRSVIIDWFEYTLYSEDDFLSCFTVNFEKRLSRLFDKEYVLQLFRNDWVLFRMIPYDTVKKISRLAGLDEYEVISFRDSNSTWTNMK